MNNNRQIKYTAESLAKLLDISKSFNDFCLLNSNNYKEDKYSKYNLLAGIGAHKQITVNNKSLDELYNFQKECNDTIFGFLSFDIKNEIEDLKSENFDGIKMPSIHFFQPKLIIKLQNNNLIIKQTHPDYKELADEVSEMLQNNNSDFDDYNLNLNLKQRTSEEEYHNAITKILEHIQYGDVFEVNYCMEFFDDNAKIDAEQTYLKLNKNSPTPFSSFFKFNNKYVISASPERYLQRHNNKLISQPIKGTIKRGKSTEEDRALIHQLKNDIKELSENKMIVDLVRNDLSRTALPASVKVAELCEIYSFNQVHQMISTIESKVNNKTSFKDIIKNSFPMGSMTGAPKVMALELIEKYEKTKRGVYSGSIGYIEKNGNFDFSVIIRSILYNQDENYLSYITGSAITRLSNAKQEYEECKLKAKGLFEILEG